MTRSVSVAVRAQEKSAARTLPLTIIGALTSSSVAALSSAAANPSWSVGSTSKPAPPSVSGSGGRDHGHAAGHRLEAGQPEALVARRHRQRAGAGVEPGKVPFGDVSEAPHAGVATAEIAAVRAGHHEVDAESLQLPPGPAELAEVLARRRGPDDEHVRLREPVRPLGGCSIGVWREPLVDALGNDGDLRRVQVQSFDQITFRELRDRDNEPGAPGDRRQQPPLIGHVAARIGLRTPERGGVVDHDDIAGEQHRCQVRRRVQQRRPRSPEWQHRLLPRVAGAVGERRRRPDRRIAIGSERRKAHRHLAREALDAADLGADRGAGVDGDGN